MNINLDNKYEILNTNFEVQNISLKEIFSLSEKTILFFYPKDATPWCSLENKDFTFFKEEFLKKWIQLIWVSKDSIESHKKFITNYELKNPLISDTSLTLHKELWAFWEKNNYWKIVQGVIRSTFLFDNKWNLLKQWKNIKAKWHVEKILKEL